MLVVGMVAAQFCTARCRIDLHLPARAEIQLKLLQCGAVPRTLAAKLLFRISVQCPELLVPLPCGDPLPKLCAGCHDDPSLRMLS